MELTKELSDRKNKNGNQYLDLFLTWSHEGKEYKVRISPCFHRDFRLLVSAAKDTRLK